MDEQANHYKLLKLANVNTRLYKKYIQEEFLTMTRPFNETINREFEEFLNENECVISNELNELLLEFNISKCNF